MAERPIPVEARLNPDPPGLFGKLVRRQRGHDFGGSCLLLLWVLKHRFGGTFGTYPGLVPINDRSLTSRSSTARGMVRTGPGGKVKPPAEGLLLPEPEGWTSEVELDGFVLFPFPLFAFLFPVPVPGPVGPLSGWPRLFPLPLERTFGSG